MAATPPRIWWTRKAILLHCILAVCVPGFVALFWWQVQRVREGNGLSWAYVFEWPFFTGYAIYLWWRLVHEQDEVPTTPAGAGGGADRAAPAADDASAATETPAPPGPVVATDADEDEELAAYNRYLAELNASARPKRW